jgi:hypothetical protein
VVCQENLEGGSFTSDPEGYVKEGSGKQASLSTGALLGNQKGRIIDWGLSEMDKGRLGRYVKEGSGNRQLYP